MDCARILLSLPSELAEIKRQLIQQQNELKIIEQAQRDSREKHNDTENELRDPQKDELSPRKQKAHPEIRDVDYGDDKKDTDRIVIDIAKPKTVALNKYKREQELKEEFVPKCSPKTQKASKAREPVTKKDLDQHSPTIFEIQRDENGALKVVTSKDDSGREKKMLPTDLPDVTGYHRPPMRGHPTREGTLKKDRKKIESRKIENRKCPVCSYYFPGLSDSEFAEHVDRHFEDEASEFFELVGRVD